MRFNPPEVIAQVHEQERHGARLGLLFERYGLLDDEPMKLRKAIGVEILGVMRPLQTALIHQRAQLVRHEPTHLGRAERQRREVLREIEGREMQAARLPGAQRVVESLRRLRHRRGEMGGVATKLAGQAQRSQRRRQRKVWAGLSGVRIAVPANLAQALEGRVRENVVGAERSQSPQLGHRLEHGRARALLGGVHQAIRSRRNSLASTTSYSWGLGKSA